MNPSGVEPSASEPLAPGAIGRFPIAILSFDRPEYLREVLTSLRVQTDERDRITLFQDGAWNPYSARKKADPANIQACVELFRRIFPWGEIAASEQNLGIAQNYERAELELFGRARAPCALFLEDDLVLSPNYLAVTRMLLELAQREKRIAYVSAYGDFWASREEQEKRRRELIHMHENWGFAMSREAWLEERPFRRQYLELLAGRDYTERDDARIRAFYRARRWTVNVTSQDCARWIASIELNKVRLTTVPCHARYIGRRGVHSTKQAYDRAGFAKTVIFDGQPETPRSPTPAEIDAWVDLERRRFGAEPSPFYRGHAIGT